MKNCRISLRSGWWRDERWVAGLGVWLVGVIKIIYLQVTRARTVKTKLSVCVRVLCGIKAEKVGLVIVCNLRNWCSNCLLVKYGASFANANENESLDMSKCASVFAPGTLITTRTLMAEISVKVLSGFWFYKQQLQNEARRYSMRNKKYK